VFRPRQLRWGLLKKEPLMENKHGLKCPLDWDKLPSHYKWLAVDKDGEIWAFENKPKVLRNPHWQAVDYNFWFKGKTDPPADFKKCLWKRPKGIKRVKNEHGLECPVSWNEIASHLHWIAIDANGTIYAHCERPILGDATWEMAKCCFTFICKAAPPDNFTQCLWQRPKSESE
jgi:hypothetical protein